MIAYIYIYLNIYICIYIYHQVIWSKFQPCGWGVGSGLEDTQSQTFVRTFDEYILAFHDVGFFEITQSAGCKPFIARTKSRTDPLTLSIVMTTVDVFIHSNSCASWNDTKKIASSFPVNMYIYVFGGIFMHILYVYVIYIIYRYIIHMILWYNFWYILFFPSHFLILHYI